MRRYIPTALAVSIAISLSAWPAVANPSPAPPVLEHVRSGTPNRPEPNVDRAKASLSRPSARPKGEQLPSGLARPVRRLLSAMKGGLIDRQSAGGLAVGMVTASDSVPTEFRLTGKESELDLMVLGAIVREEADISPNTSSGRQAPNSLVCVYYDLQEHHVCTYTGTHSSVIYVQEALTAEEAADNYNEDVPDYIEDWVRFADQSWEYYRNTLQMTPVSDLVVFDLVGDGTVCASWPNARIYCGPHFEPASLDWLVPHEMFHQFQWHYFPSSLLASPVVWVVDLVNINPWMESTANWAAAHFARDELYETPTTLAREAEKLDDFFADVNEGLVARGPGSADTISGPRAYGAMPVVEFFTQQMSDEFVKRSFEVLNPVYLDGYSQVGDASASLGFPLDQMLAGLWLAMYSMCDPGNGGDWWRLRGGMVSGWCDNSDVQPSSPGTPTKRPAHHTVPMLGSAVGEHEFSLSRYGAGFIDFVLDVPSNSAGTTLALEFDSTQVATGDEVTVIAWKDTPGGDSCQVGVGAYPASVNGKTALRMQVPNGCGYATLLLVNTGGAGGAFGAGASYPVSWSLFSTGAVIGNGTISLGVTADGGLGLGSPRIWFCRGSRTMAGRTSSDILEPGQGLVEDATGFDAIRDSWHEMCRDDDLSEGWSVADANVVIDGRSTSWSKPALGIPSEYEGVIESFSYTASEATAVVPLGARYKLIHHWHPTLIDSRAYQLDVTIEPTGVYGSIPLVYRRVVPLEINGWDFDVTTDHVAMTRGTNDGVADATTSLFWDSDDDSWPGLIDDPLVALPHDAFDEWGPYRARGFAVDIVVGNGSRTTPDAPDFSLFYGFAGTSSQANSVLGALGASTSVVAQLPAEDATHIVLVGLRDTP